MAVIDLVQPQMISENSQAVSESKRNSPLPEIKNNNKANIFLPSPTDSLKFYKNRNGECHKILNIV